MLSPHPATGFYIGTIGFSYTDWINVFYPAGMPARSYLAYYSRIFNAVEIDSTFYGAPNEQVVRRWTQSVPEDFKFSLKAPRAITHEAGLVGVADQVDLFLERAYLLGDKLGAVLLQFPPSFMANQIGVMDEFLAGLPGDIRFAVEVRHQSWYTAVAGEKEPPIASVLRNTGACWAATEYPGLPARIHLTSDFLYIRWIGQHGSYSNHDHERINKTVTLRNWWQHIRDFLGQVDTVLGFFNNDYAGFAAGTANRFKQIAGLETMDFIPPRQGVLF